MKGLRRTTTEALSVVSADFELSPGSPLPLGPTVQRGGVNFAIVSETATSATLVLFLPGEDDPILEFPLDPVLNRTGHIWHALLEGLDAGIEYGYRFDRSPNEAPRYFRFDPSKILLDPYARATSRNWSWGAAKGERQLRSVVADSDFDWGFDKPLRTPLSDTIIYELHVRGFTQHPSSRVTSPGTFAGLVEKIPYLQELGVTAVELMPVCEFDEVEMGRRNPVSGAPLVNFWGYHPIAFFSPNAAYSAKSNGRAAALELKEMIRAFHRAGIEVILDVVFNHTGEGAPDGPVCSFRGIDNPLYYMVQSGSGSYLDYTGCGNTLNCSHPIVRQMVLDALRHWVSEYHVDGFRFDLASALSRDRDGKVLASPPLLERIVADPCLADVKLIAEAWDAAGLYQVGNFPAYGRWAEWNGKFRDDIRRFVKGDPGMVPALASRLTGSADLYQSSARQPFHSINFVTCHDGFTLQDLVAYQQKHNEENGEENRDGSSENLSWSCGTEGGTADPEIEKLRRRQVRNFASLLILSHGVPMILYGDETGRTQKGNNNAYCQDNDLTWMNWELSREQSDLLRFFKNLIQFRRSHPALRRECFESSAAKHPVEMHWHGRRVFQADWSPESRSLALHLKMGGDSQQEDNIFIIANAHWEGSHFELPQLEGRTWVRFLDTSVDPPHDICEVGREKQLEDVESYKVGARSVVVLVLGRQKPRGRNECLRYCET
jgi:isoamylase